MTTNTVSTRRRFFWKVGAVLSAPLAATSSRALSRDSGDRAALEARLAKLEDIDAIRALNRTLVRLVNARDAEAIAALFAVPAEAPRDASIRSMTADGFGADDVIEIAADCKTATARIHCTVETETPIEPSCPLVEMARAQGDGVVRRAERRVLESAYVKRGGLWKIAPRATAALSDRYSEPPPSTSAAIAASLTNAGSANRRA